MSEDLAWRAACMAAGGQLLDPTHLEPEKLAQILRRHRLIGHSHRCASRWSAAQRSLLRPLWIAGQARCLAHLQAQTQAIVQLQREGIRVAALKGIAFQQALTGRPDGRDHRDIDLWVSPADLEAACAVLLNAGWESVYLADRRRWAGPLPNEISFSSAAGLTLDLHHRLFARRYALDQTEGAIEALRRPDGSLSALGHGFLATLHGAKDGWNTLRHIADLHLVFSSLPHADLAKLARRTRTRRALDVGAYLAEALIGPTGWIYEEVVSGIAQRLIQDLHSPLNDQPSGRRALTYLRTRESWRDRSRFVLGIPLQVSAADEPEARPIRRVLSRTKRLFHTYVLLEWPFGGRVWHRRPSSES